MLPNHYSPKIILMIPLKGKLKIDEFKDKSIPPKSSIVLIDSVSSFGLSFSSHLDFPANTELIIKVTFKLFGQFFSFRGIIINRKEQDHNHFIYDVRLINPNIGYIKATQREVGLNTISHME